jgi:hypothetical protein
MAAVQTSRGFMVPEIPWDVFFVCKFKYCDMRAKTRVVEQEGPAVARKWLIKHVSTATNTTQQQRNCWKRCFLLALLRSYTARASSQLRVTVAVENARTLGAMG